jgi:hypothetical protein
MTCGSSLSKSLPGAFNKISIELAVECLRKPMTDGLNDNRMMFLASSLARFSLSPFFCPSAWLPFTVNSFLYVQ